MDTGSNASIVLDLDEDASSGTTRPDVAIPTSTGASSVEVDEDIDELDRLPERAIQNSDGSVTLPLLHPQSLTIKKDGKTRSEAFDKLTFHRLNGADQRAIGAASDENSAVVAFARSTRMMQARMNVLFDKLDLEDIADATRVLSSFLGNGRTTGRRS